MAGMSLLIVLLHDPERVEQRANDQGRNDHHRASGPAGLVGPGRILKRSLRTSDTSVMRALARFGVPSCVILFIGVWVAAPAAVAATEGPTPITFARTTNGNTDVYTVLSDGTDLTHITSTVSIDRDPSWSPNGKRIVFSSNRSGTFDLWEKDPTQGWLRQLTRGPAADRQPSWSPDGSRIAFIRAVPGHAEVWLLDLDTMKATQLTHNDAHAAHPDWIDSSDWVVYDSDVHGPREIDAIQDNGQNDYQLVPGSGADSDPSAGPKNVVAFASDRSGGPAIWTWDETTHSAVQLTDGSATDGAPTWSAYGTMFAFTRDTGGGTHLYTMSSDGSGQTQITSGVGIIDAEPNWAPLTVRQRADDDMVKNNLLRALNDVNTFYASDGSYVNATPFHLLVLDPYFTWNNGSTPSNSPTIISIDVSGSSSETVALAVMSLSGECFALRDTNGTAVTYGITATAVNCTGSWAAANATSPDGWPV